MCEKSSLPGALAGFGLTLREQGAIASVIAPLMVIFVNVAAPRPALAQTAKDKKTEGFALFAPQRTTIAMADGALPLVLKLAVGGPRGSFARRADATPERQELLESLRPPTRPAPALMREPIVGIASMYNPYTPGEPSGGVETASGELYDAQNWTAAIRIDLRGRFGGVRYSNEYRAAYALIESEDKRAIVKINDVGPLAPGRVIDLNERVMRHFDPALTLGLLANVRITPLDGRQWTPGPLDDKRLINVLPAAGERPQRAQLAKLN